MARNNLVDRFMAETINFGGFAVTRKECYDIMVAEGDYTNQAIDRFAFGRPELTDEQIEYLIPRSMYEEVMRESGPLSQRLRYKDCAPSPSLP